MKIGVVGAGTMGVGIAHAFVVNGISVVLVEAVEEQRRRALETLVSVLSQGVDRGKLTKQQATDAEAKLTIISAVDQLPTGLDVAIEAVPERPEPKAAVLAQLEGREPLLLGSNTSSISISQLAYALRNPAQFLGIHFFNPVWSKHLVELVVGEHTHPAAIESARRAMAAIKKEVIIVRDAPGFATSRLGVLLGLEAIRILESGIASAEDIDKAMEMGYGHPMGPLRLTDLVGLDVRLDIAENLARAYGDRFAPPRLLEDLVAEGRLGKKSGRGFYQW